MMDEVTTNVAHTVQLDSRTQKNMSRLDRFARLDVLNKPIVAFCLKCADKRFSAYSLEDIERKFIDPLNDGRRLTPLDTVSRQPIHPHPTIAHDKDGRAETAAHEQDVVSDEVQYDDFFRVYAPTPDEWHLETLYINIDIQLEVRRWQDFIVRVWDYGGHALSEMKMRFQMKRRELRREERRKAVKNTAGNQSVDALDPEADALAELEDGEADRTPVILDSERALALWFLLRPSKKLAGKDLWVIGPADDNPDVASAIWTLLPKDAESGRLRVRAGIVCAAPPAEGKEWTTLANMLYALFGEDMDFESRMDILENKFKMHGIRELLRREGDDVVTLSEQILEKGVDIGIEKGVDIGIEKARIEDLLSLEDVMSFDEAYRALKMPEDLREHYRDKVWEAKKKIEKEAAG